jgi:putative ABC transport system permease protein
MGPEPVSPAPSLEGVGISSWESVQVALKMLGANKLRTGLTMLGIVIGVFAVITLVSLGASARRYVADRFAVLGANLMIIMPGRQDTIGGEMMVNFSSVHKLTLEDAEAIRRRLPSITGVAPVVYGIGRIKQENVSRNTWVTGTGYEYPTVRDHWPALGQFISLEDVDRERRVAVLGAKARRELFGEANPLGKFITVMGSPFRVIGVMESRGTSLGFDLDDVVFVPVSVARRLFNTDSMYHILVRAGSDEEVPGAAASIRKLIQSRHNGEDDITIVSQNQLLATLNSILEVLTIILSCIAAISLVVGGIGIMNIMLASISERTQEIGLRKALGARARDILIQFLVESAVLATLGGVIGVLITGLAVLAARRVFPSIPIVMTLWAVILAVTFSAGMGIFFGVFPARRASRLSPMDALRTE